MSEPLHTNSQVFASVNEAEINFKVQLWLTNRIWKVGDEQLHEKE